MLHRRWESPTQTSTHPDAPGWLENPNWAVTAAPSKGFSGLQPAYSSQDFLKGIRCILYVNRVFQGHSQRIIDDWKQTHSQAPHMGIVSESRINNPSRTGVLWFLVNIMSIPPTVFLQKMISSSHAGWHEFDPKTGHGNIDHVHWL